MNAIKILVAAASVLMLSACGGFALNDLLYLTQYYSQSEKAEKSGLYLIYHDSVQDEEMRNQQKLASCLLLLHESRHVY